MTDDSTPRRATLRGEFLRAERHLARAVEAESQVERLIALVDRLAGRIAAVEDQTASLEQLAIPEVTPSEDMRAAFRLAARGLRAALSECGHPNHCGVDHNCGPFAPARVECADCGPVDPEHGDAHDEHHASPSGQSVEKDAEERKAALARALNNLGISTGSSVNWRDPAPLPGGAPRNYAEQRGLLDDSLRNIPPFHYDVPSAEQGWGGGWCTCGGQPEVTS